MVHGRRARPSRLESIDGPLAALAHREALVAEDFSDLCPSLRVTFSAGVTMNQRAESDAAAIERADRAMYRAKDDARDRPVVH